MIWTKEKPRKAGWYWVWRSGRVPEIRRFERYPGSRAGGNIEPVDGRFSTEGWEKFCYIPHPKNAEQVA